MTWSSTGNVASYPTVTPAKSASMTSFAAAFRADLSAGIVYVTGTFGTGGALPTTGLTAAPLSATFRPLAAVFLPLSTPNSGASTTTQLVVNPDGSVGVSGAATATTYAVRTFYFTSVTPG